MNMKRFFICLVAVLAVFSVCGCRNGKSSAGNGAASSSATGKSSLPESIGRPGEVLVVLNKEQWEGKIGERVKEFLCADCPYLPHQEPMFTTTEISHKDFDKVFRVYRNIFSISVSSSYASTSLRYDYDRWASGQLVVTVEAVSEKECLALLEKDAATIVQAFEQVERQRVIDNAYSYQELSLLNAVNDFTGGGMMVFPAGFSMKKQNDSFLWMSYETTYVQQGIFVYKYPAEGGLEESTLESIIGRRNEILMKEVPGMTEGSYMTTSPVWEPSIKYLSYHGRKFVEVRGFWDVQGDYMGGPFVSHTFYSPDKKEMICLEAYVYAPRYDKRQYLRQVEALLYSFEWKNIL